MDNTSGDSKQRVSQAPFIVEPTLSHYQTFILLHGFGSNGEKFGKELLAIGASSRSQSLTEIFPRARFIFPTAKLRRSTQFNRTMVTQWFDLASFENPSYRSHTQIQGLEESCAEIHQLIMEEAAKVTAEKVTLGGLSQGCAMALISLLALDFPLGAFIGMSGWLPFCPLIRSYVDDKRREHDPDDPFAPSEADTPAEPRSENQAAVVTVQGYVRDLLGLPELENPSEESTAIRTSVLLGHGDADEKISHSLGLDALLALQSMRFRLCWKSYSKHGHGFKMPDWIDDIEEWVGDCVGHGG